ncbi:MAG: hypothetical protein ACOCV2_04170 [Persicimonas sp.]
MSEKVIIPGPDAASDRQESQEPSSPDDQPDRLGWEMLFEFQAMVTELRQTEGIVDVYFRRYEPVPDFTIETIEHGLGTRVPDRIKSFYRVTDGLEFGWSYTVDGETLPGGGAHLFDFATVFDNWLDSLWSVDPEEFSESELDFFWSLRGFDRLGDAEAGHMIVLCVEEEYPTYDLFVHDLHTRDSKLLELTFGEYIDRLLESRGAYGWQHLLTEEPATDSTITDHVFEMAERFFPEADLGGD